MSEFQIPWLLVAMVTAGVLFILTLAGSSMTAAVPALRLARQPIPVLVEGLLYGATAFSVVAFIAVLAGLRLDAVFWLTGALAILSTTLRIRRGAVPAVLALSDSEKARWSSDGRLQWWALAIIVVGSFVWSIDNLRGLQAAPGGGAVMIPWVDIFFHARQIGNFANFDGDRSTLHLTMYGEPVQPYHYASYMIAAVVSRFTNAPSIQAATAVYPIVGMLFTGLSMLVLAQSTIGAKGALLAVAILFGLPDPSCWLPPGQRMTSYFFFQQVGIGGAYAVGVMGLALACGLKSRETSRKVASWALCLFSLAALFKVQIFLAYGAPFLLLVIWWMPNTPNLQRLLTTALAVVVIVPLVALLQRVPNAPTLALSTAALRPYLDFIFSRIGSGHPSSIVVLALLPLALLKEFIGVYGILFPVTIALCWILRKDSASRTSIQLVALFLISHACVRFLIADNQGSGDVAEINRKTFVWPYFVLVYCCAALTVRYFSLARSNSPRWGLVTTLACGLVTLSVIGAWQLQTWPQARAFVMTPVPAGLLAVAARLRETSPAGDVVQLCHNDPYNLLGTLSERPVFIAKIAVNAPAATPSEVERFRALAALMAQDTVAGAVDGLRTAGIKWLVMAPGCAARFERSAVPAFSAGGGYRVYRTPL